MDKESLLLYINALTSRLTELEQKKAEYSRFLVNNDDININDDGFNAGDTSWLLCATTLVLSMTIPGLAFYYAGMVRVRNVLATLVQVFTLVSLITILWLICGYSLSFSPIDSANKSFILIGDGSRLWLEGMTATTFHQLAPTIPESIFCAYQLTFAIITVGLICGSFADRMKFESVLSFLGLWHIVVYCPIAHMFWHPDGFLFKAGVMDYAGGCVVHLSSGIASLVAAIVLGYRRGFGVDRFDPNNIILSFMGACMLWVGWFGFNAGSAYAANDRACMAFLNTHICASMAALSWVTVESIMRGKPSVLGMISGAFSGLVCITPAAGYVDTTAAFVIGIYGGPLCYLGCQLKHVFGFDDALDAFGIHAIGGAIGILSVAFFANKDIGGYSGVFYANVHDGGYRFGIQLSAIAVTIAWSAVWTFVILKVVELCFGLRVSESDEINGLDRALHGESIESNTKIPPTSTPNFDIVKSRRK